MQHPDYSILAGRVLATKIHKTTMKSFSSWVNAHGTGWFILLFLFAVALPITGPRAIFRPDFVAAVEEHGAALDEAVVHARDFELYLCVAALPVQSGLAHCGSAIPCRRCTSRI